MSYLPSNSKAMLMDAFLANPELAHPLHSFAERLMRGPSPFTAAQREAIAVRVSTANGCAFCEASHAAAARHLGLDEDALAAARDGAADAYPETALRPVLAYADKLNRAPANVGQADVDAVLQAGWDETALHHAALVCGFFNLMNRWVDGLGLESDAQTSAMAGRMLAREGYGAINRLLGQNAQA